MRLSNPRPAGRRRAALALLLAAAIAPGALAQPRDRVRRIGYLSGGANSPEFLAKPLADLGWVEGKNLLYEIRVVPADPPELAAVAAELARQEVDVLLAYLTPRVEALANATRTIPIVCGIAPDPVGAGFAESLRRPGKNVTGLSYGVPEQAEIRIALMRILRPQLKRIVAILQYTSRAPSSYRSVVAAARAAGITFDFTEVPSMVDAERLFASLDPPADAVDIIGLPENVPSAGVLAIALGRRIATFGNEETAREGALMSYLISHRDPHRKVAAILDKLLRGANPANIPFELPDRTSFVVNRATAKAIGLTLPPEILFRATEVIG